MSSVRCLLLKILKSYSTALILAKICFWSPATWTFELYLNHLQSLWFDIHSFEFQCCFPPPLYVLGQTTQGNISFRQKKVQKNFLSRKWTTSLPSFIPLAPINEDSWSCGIFKIDYVVFLWIHGISLGHFSHPKLARARLSAQMLAVVLESQRLWFMKFWLWYKHPCYLLHWGSGTTPVGTSMRTYNVPSLPHCVDNSLAGQAFQIHCFREMNHSFVKNEKKRAQIPSKKIQGFAAHITDIMLPAREHWIGLLTESINATL